MSHGFLNDRCQFTTQSPTTRSQTETPSVGKVFRKLTNLQRSDPTIAIVAGKRSLPQPKICCNRYSRCSRSSIPSLPLQRPEGIIGLARHL
jgi:hypothetical protein